jgi:2-iminobutanoate/2-iminopropanoate deaminase
MLEFIDGGLDAHWSATLAESTGLARPPFSPAATARGTLVFVSGQTYPVIGDAGAAPASESSMADQTRACLVNLDAVLAAAGASRTDVVKVTIFNTRMSEQAAVNAEYSAYFGDHRPTRSHVEVSALADPDLLVEIEAIAVIDAQETRP